MGKGAKMAFSHEELYQDLVVREGITVCYKDEHWWWRVLGQQLCENFVTTLGTTVYFPSREWVKRSFHWAWVVICQEAVHVEAYRRHGFMFYVLYCFPQWLGLLALLSPLLWSWWPLAFLVFLAPWPAPWRYQFELRAYAMGLAVEHWYHRRGVPPSLRDMVVSQLSGSTYYFMWPFEGAVTRDIGRWSKRILCNETDGDGDVFRRIRLLVTLRRALS